MDNRMIKKLITYYVVVLAALLVAFSVYVAAYGKDAVVTELAVAFAACVIFLAVIFFLIGLGSYVHHDARARGMQPVLWALIAVFGPYFVGLIIYLIVRSPLPARCTSCGALSPMSSTFCPQCGRPLQRRCGSCNVAVEAQHRFCQACGAALPES